MSDTSSKSSLARGSYCVLLALSPIVAFIIESHFASKNMRSPQIWMTTKTICVYALVVSFVGAYGIMWKRNLSNGSNLVAVISIGVAFLILNVIVGLLASRLAILGDQLVFG